MRKVIEKIAKTVNSIKKQKEKLWLRAMGLPVFFMAFSNTVLASGEAVGGINTLVDLASNIISALGAFVVLWGIFELGNAMQSHDGAQTGQAGKRIAGGIVMVVAPQILKLFV